MNTKHILHKLIPLLAGLLVLTACAGLQADPTQTNEADAAPLAMANPADVYCQGLGYSTEIVERNGGQDSDCILPDNTRCETWDLLAGRCGQEFSFCEQQGGKLEASDANIGTCRFPDASFCSEIEYFTGDCQPGDNPGEAGVQGISEQVAPESAPVEIKDFVQARDFLAAYLLEHYGVGAPEAWTEENITSAAAAGTSTLRYVSGLMTITIEAEASAPYAALYTIKEASDLSNGFYWEGTLSFDGLITEIRVIPVSSIQDSNQARDAVLAFLANTYSLNFPGEWSDAGITQGLNNTVMREYKSGAWTIQVVFAPSAPLVSSYSVTVENLSEGLRWVGDINSRSGIKEISITR